MSEERQASIEYLGAHTLNPNSGWLGLAVIVVGSTLAFMFNVATYFFIMYTSALTSTIGSIGIKVGLIGVSAITDGLTAPLAWVGIAIVLISIVVYGYLTYMLKQKETAKEASDKAEPLAAKEAPPVPQPAVDENTPLKGRWWGGSAA